MKTKILVVITLIISGFIFAQDQNFSVSFKKNKIEYSSENGLNRVITIDLESVNTSSSNWQDDWLIINVLDGGMTTLFPYEYSIVTDKLLLNTLDIKHKIYITIDDKAVLKDKKIVLQLNVVNKVTKQNKNDYNKGNIKNLEIVFNKTKNSVASINDTISLKDYLNPKLGLELQETIKVESNDNVLTVSGYDYEDNFVKRKIILERNKILPVSTKSYFFNSRHWKPIPFSIITVPFKIRPEIKLDEEVKNSIASSGITNIGLNLDLAKYQLDRYFASGKKSSHKFSLGVWGAPAVEELDSISTRGFLPKGKISKQMFLSTGLTISYSYNDVSFVFVPIGLDFGTSTIGKNWIYNKRRWWGFGIAISPKIIATIFNK
jgi:hypothetical protein